MKANKQKDEQVWTKPERRAWATTADELRLLLADPAALTPAERKDRGKLERKLGLANPPESTHPQVNHPPGGRAPEHKLGREKGSE